MSEPETETMMQSPNLTRHQALVLDALVDEGSPASAYALLERLRADGLRAPSQVYRALGKLLEHGLVHRLESQNAYVACAQPHRHEHGMVAFAICDHCGRVDEFSDATVEKRLKGWSNDNAFRVHGVAIELHGTCGNCQTL